MCMNGDAPFRQSQYSTLYIVSTFVVVQSKSCCYLVINVIFLIVLVMGGCRCSYKNCKSATKTTENLHFFHYPVKHTERCRKWIENACKPQFFDLAEDQLRNKVVCELHFEERCFTNISRRRLLHDAIPTLDAGAEDDIVQRVEYHPNHIQSDEIHVLPANEDGTLFTVDTDSFQQIPASDKIESYIYSNGALVPLYKTEPDSVEQNVIYTVEDSHMENERRNSKSRNGNVVLHNSGKQNLQPKTYRLLFDTFTESESTETVAMDDEDTSNCTIDSQLEESKHSIESNTMEIDDGQQKKVKNVQVVNTKMAQRVKQHSKEIALLKKTLKSTVIQNRQKYKKSALGSLAPLLPPTLYSLVKRSVKKGEVDSTEQDMELFREIHTASPALYDNLREKYGWNLPDSSSLC